MDSERQATGVSVEALFEPERPVDGRSMAYDLKARPPKAVAMVRAGEQAHLYQWCRDSSCITIGWFWDPPTNLGDWSLGQLESQFRFRYPVVGESGKAGYRNKTSQTRALGCISDFLYSLPVGRRVLIGSPEGGHTLLLGEIVGGYEFHPEWNVGGTKFDPYVHFKRVRWIGEILRSELHEAADLGWTDQNTVWWIEDLAAIGDIESSALAHPIEAGGATGGPDMPTHASTSSAVTPVVADLRSPLTPLTDKDSIDAAYVEFENQLTENIAPTRHGAGWKGGWGEFDVYWHETESFWCFLDPKRAQSRYWCCFGPGSPDGSQDLSITCEINFAYEGAARRIAGAFLRDDEGRVFISHSGKIGGGKEGVGKQAFLDYLDAPTKARVQWPDGQVTEVLLLGMLGSPTLLGGISLFVSEAAAFKTAVREGTMGSRQLSVGVGEQDDGQDLGDYFSESLLGSTSFDQRTRQIEMRLLHGPVVHALRAEIESVGLTAKKNRRVDLAAVDASNACLVLFEAKTSVGWSALYGAIGQLMFHGRSASLKPRALAVVLPEGGPADLDSRLMKLGISTVRYAHSAAGLTFTGLDGLLVQA